MKTSHHMDCIALIATSKTNYKEWPYVSMFSWSIDHLKNGRQVGGGDCWKKTAGLTNLLSASLQGKGAHADLFILSWISRQWWRVQSDVRRGVLTDEVSEKSNSFSNTSLRTASLDSVTDSFLGEKQIFGSFLTDLCSRLLWKDNKKLVSSSSQTFPRGNLRRKGGK